MVVATDETGDNSPRCCITGCANMRRETASNILTALVGERLAVIIECHINAAAGQKEPELKRVIIAFFVRAAITQQRQQGRDNLTTMHFGLNK